MTGDTGRGYLLLTDTDRAGLIVIFAATLICWSLLVSLFRLSGRVPSRHVLALEEWAIATSTVFGVACSITIVIAVKYGFGKNQNVISLGRYDSLAKALYAVDLLYILALTFSKFATLELLRTLSPAREHNLLCHGLGAFITLWAVAAFLTIALRCQISTPWLSLTSQQCRNLFDRWLALESISLLIEVLIFLAALNMIQILQATMKTKAKAIGVFAVRLPVIVPAIMRLVFLKRAFHSTNYTLEASGAIIALQCLMHYSVMSASFSYLRPYLTTFNSYLGGTIKLETINAAQPRSASHWQNVERSNSSPAAAAAFRSQARVETGERRVVRQHSQDSDAPIIHKTISYSVNFD